MSIYNSTENLWNKNRNKTLHENHLCQNIHIQTCATQLWGGGCSELGLKGWGKSLTCALVPEVWQIFNIWCTFSMAGIVAWCWFAFHREIFRIKSNYIGKKWYKCKYCNNAKHNYQKYSFHFFSKLVSDVKEMKERSMQTYSAKTRNVVFIHCFAPLLHLKYLFIRQCKFASYSDYIH